MKPPSNEPSRPASGASTPQPTNATSAAPDGSKVEGVKTESDKAASPVAPAKPGSDQVRAEAAKPESAKSEAAGTSGAGPTAKPSSTSPGTTTGPTSAPAAKPDASSQPTSKPDLAKPDLAKSGAADASKASASSTGRTDAPKVDPSKAETPRSAAFGASPSGTRGGEAATDGPIIDLKARRMPDSPDKTATASSPTGPKTGETKPGESRNTAATATASGAGTTSAKPVETVPTASQKNGAGFGSIAAAGLLGGVIGAGLLFGIERAGVLPNPAGDVAGRLAALDQKVGTLPNREELASLETRISGNEAALKPLPEAVRAADAAARDALQKAGAAPASGGAPGEAAPAAAIPADLVARLDSLDQRVSALQEEPGRDQNVDAKAPLFQGNGGSPDQVANLDTRLKAVEVKLDGAAAPAAQPDLGPKLTALQGEVESRTKANADAAQSLSQKLAALQANLDERVKSATEAVQTATEASRQAVDANKAQAEETARAVARQIQAQADKIASLDKAVSERAETGTVEAALRVVSADRITTALSTGVPYADALNSLRNLEPGDPARLNAVAAFADKGSPTARSLATEFRAISERIAASRKAAEARSLAETGNVGQRLMSMAESIVQVRKVDTPAAAKAEGPDPLVEVQAALDRGAIAEAAKAFAALPDNLRSEAGDFGTKLQSRAVAGEAAQALLSDAFKGLSVPARSR